MARSSFIDDIYKLAISFEETIPPTLPARAIPKHIKDKNILVEEFSLPPTTRFSAENNLTIRDIKHLVLRFNHIYSLSHGAAKLLLSGKRRDIFDPKIGIDSYIEPITQEIKEINSMIGKRVD